MNPGLKSQNNFVLMKRSREKFIYGVKFTGTQHSVALFICLSLPVV